MTFVSDIFKTPESTETSFFSNNPKIKSFTREDLAEYIKAHPNNYVSPNLVFNLSNSAYRKVDRYIDCLLDPEMASYYEYLFDSRCMNRKLLNYSECDWQKYIHTSLYDYSYKSGNYENITTKEPTNKQKDEMDKFKMIKFFIEDLLDYFVPVFSKDELAIRLTPYLTKGFENKQLKQILKGLKQNLAVDSYADPKFDWEQMREIRLGLQRNFNVSIYASLNYDVLQMDYIYAGIRNNIDYTIYADPKYTWIQMREIYKGLKDKLDVSTYADPYISPQIMHEIRLGIKHNVGILNYTYRGYNDDQLRQIRLGLEQGIDVSLYADPRISHYDMERVRLYAKRSSS